MSEKRASWRNNRNAATLAVLALFVLAPAMQMPFISLKTLGQSRQSSLLSGIGELLQGGHVFLGLLLAVFCVAFPFAKLLAILVATSSLAPLSLIGRKRLCQFAAATGKYSLLDLLVVAVLIVLFKFGGAVQVEPRAGTWLFGLGVLLSIAAGTLTCFEHLEGSST